MGASSTLLFPPRLHAMEWPQTAAFIAALPGREVSSLEDVGYGGRARVVEGARSAGKGRSSS